MIRFFPPRSYRNGGVAAAVTLSYLGIALLLIVVAASEAALPGAEGGGFFGFAMLVTMPLSFAVLGLYSTAATAQGVALPDQHVAGWMFVAFAACGLITAGLVWVVFPGRRIGPPVEPDVASGPDGWSHR